MGIVRRRNDPVELWRRTGLGPCRASVTLEAVRLESGAQRFRLVEAWTPPHDGFGEIVETTLVASEETGRAAAGRAAEEWQQGSGRSERLAPGGRLRADSGEGRIVLPARY